MTRWATSIRYWSFPCRLFFSLIEPVFLRFYIEVLKIANRHHTDKFDIKEIYHSLHISIINENTRHVLSWWIAVRKHELQLSRNLSAEDVQERTHTHVLYVIRKLATLGSWPLIFCSCLCCTKCQIKNIIGKLESRSTEWEYLKNENCLQINPMNEWFLIFRYHSTFTMFTRCCLNMASFACAEL